MSYDDESTRNSGLDPCQSFNVTRIFLLYGSTAAWSLPLPFMLCSKAKWVYSCKSDPAICGLNETLFSSMSNFIPSIISRKALMYMLMDQACKMHELKGSGLSPLYVSANMPFSAKMRSAMQLT